RFWNRVPVPLARRLLLLSPVQELLVLEQEDFQSRIHDMIRRAFDERGVLFDGRDDNVLQLVLSLNEFRSFVDDRHILPPCELSASLDVGKTLCKKERVFRSCGLERPPMILWAAEGSQKWGR